jgi:hypothetical protein
MYADKGAEPDLTGGAAGWPEMPLYRSSGQSHAHPLLSQPSAAICDEKALSYAADV